MTPIEIINICKIDVPWAFDRLIEMNEERFVKIESVIKELALQVSVLMSMMEEK